VERPEVLEAQAALRFVSHTGHVQNMGGVPMYWSAYYNNWCTWDFIWNIWVHYGRQR
jgi:hypothetical protein